MKKILYLENNFIFAAFFGSFLLRFLVKNTKKLIILIQQNIFYSCDLHLKIHPIYFSQ